jgi:hypothetical protein
MLVRQRRKYVHDALLYAYICMCVALSVCFVYCISITYRDFLYTRARLKIELSQLSKNIPFYLSNIILYNFFFTISILCRVYLRLG